MSNSLTQLLNQLENAPEMVEFNTVIEVITEHYHYIEVRFTSREGAAQRVNEAGTNQGSCKIFGFGKLHNLDVQQTLHCFGHYYREDVLQHPEGSDHGNIRNFMRSGWAGISFDSEPLQAK